MAPRLLKEAETLGCKRYAGAAAGDLVGLDAKVASVGDEPYGFIVNELPTDNPPAMLSIHGTGALIDLTGFLVAGAPGTVIYSDGDGTISDARPGGAAGAKIWIVGTIHGDEDADNSSVLDVNIYSIEKGA